jgi:type I restriction-modification system DNA methylase subunit
MSGQNILTLIGLDDAVSVHSVNNNDNESQLIVLNQIINKEFNVDAVHFNTDENGTSFPAIFLKKVNSFDEQTLKDIANTHQKAWNYKKVLFLYVYSETQIRIYNCSEKPVIKSQDEPDYEEVLQGIQIKSYQYSDTKELHELNKLFSKIAIDTGVIWILDEASTIRERIKLQNRVDKYLVTSLVNTAQKLQNQGLALDFIHKIILRSLFLLYLEDRNATDEKFYSNIKKDAKTYFDILEDDNATNDLYRKLDEHFNGNIFTVLEDEKISVDQLKIIKKCFISGYDNSLQTRLFENWRLFDFGIIQIELLSEIYENFLFKTDPNLKKKTGAYYTPPSLVELILNEKLPVHGNEKEFNIKILDPACGSGIFLVESFKRLVKRYENYHNVKLTDFNKLKKLLTDNVFGIEIHHQSIKVAAFSLYLALVDYLDPKTLWQNNKLPNLINDPDDKSLSGKNLYCYDSILKNDSIDSIKFDLVVGNPPFGIKDLSESIRIYCDKFNFAKEMVLPFLHKATQFAPTGEIALIFNTKVLSNTSGTYKNFRKWLFNECFVEKIYNFSILRKAPKNFGGHLFGDATGPISIVFYQKEKPKKISGKIAYYAPKTFIKSNIIDGLCIDFTDLKYLPREECQKPNSKIWKIAMWGGINDLELIKKLIKENKKFESYLVENNIDFGSGLHPKEADNSKISVEGEHIETAKIEKYYTPKNYTNRIKKEFRKNNLKLFKNPLAIIKEGITNKNILASYFDYDVFYNKTVYGFSTNEADKLKSIVIIFNSDLAKYFFFLTSSSWGIERDRIVLREYLNFPYSEINTKEIQKLDFSKLNFSTKTPLVKQEGKKINLQNWELKIQKLYKLTSEDIIRINDVVDLSVDLFHKQEKSKAFSSISQDYAIQYGQIISSQLNDFLDSHELYANATIYNLNIFSPLMMIKLSFEKEQNGIIISKEHLDDELKKLDKHLWEEKAKSIYFRKKLNYKIGNDIYIIRPNQRRFWSKSMAIDDASELIIEILSRN